MDNAAPPAAAAAASAPPARINRKALVLGLVLVLPLLAVLVFNLGRDPHSVRSPLVGRPAPDFALPAVSGGPVVSLGDLRGKPVVLNFWATWCVPCYQEHPALTSAARSLGDDVQFLGVVYDDEEARVREFLRERGSTYPSLLDPGGRTAIAYGVYGVPETYFIDPAGRIAEKYVGPLDPPTIAALLHKTRAEVR
jgi:cytochrome c biogenesis protein CcmG/thiol:disulfide interchange protein DsbE